MECDGNMDATCNMQHVVDRHYAWETGTWDVGRGTWDGKVIALGVLGMSRRFTLHVLTYIHPVWGCGCVCVQASSQAVPAIHCKLGSGISCFMIRN